MARAKKHRPEQVVNLRRRGNHSTKDGIKRRTLLIGLSLQAV
jgi:hypothetical protein